MRLTIEPIRSRAELRSRLAGRHDPPARGTYLPVLSADERGGGSKRIATSRALQIIKPHDAPEPWQVCACLSRRIALGQADRL